jgi:hypothetical protein
METGNKKNLVAQLFQFLFLGCLVLLLGMAIHNLVPQKGGANLGAGSYPYPPPTHMIAVYPMDTVGAPLPPTPIVLRSAKDGHILSPEEIGAEATYEFERSRLATLMPLHLPTQVVARFPVNSISDLPNVVYNDPFYGSDQTGFGPCILAKNTGTPVLVQDPVKNSSYYILPFFKDNQVCGQALIAVSKGFGNVFALGEARGDKFPEVSADEAIRQVQLKTGKQVIGQPTLVYFLAYETGGPESPFWKVTTSDNQVYYVLFFTGPTEGSSQITTNITVLNADEIHIIK